LKYFIELNGTNHEVELPQSGHTDHVKINGEQVKVDYHSQQRDTYILYINNRPHQIDIHPNGDQLLMQVGGINFDAVVRDERQDAVRRIIGSKSSKREGAGNIKAPMPGLIVKISVKEGDPVSKGQGILVVEAMKMENEITAPIDGVIKKCLIEEGQTVNKGELMISIEGNGL